MGRRDLGRPLSKKINSRQKGARGERILVKKFEAWWGEKFFRTPGSGAFATMGFDSEELSLAGDILTLDETFPFTVESKNAEGWHLEQLLTAPKCDIISWWKQTVNETPDGKIPLLVFTRNRQPYFFIMPIDVWSEMTMFRDDVHSAPMMMIEGRIVKLGLLDELFKTPVEGWKNVGKREGYDFTPGESGSSEAT